MRLFFFGSLMDPDLVRLVLDREIADVTFTPAALLGYERLRAKNESFPIIMPTPGGRVEGMLVGGLTADDVLRIRWYESDDYALQPCLVGIGDRRHEAHVFLATETLEAEDIAWDFAHWAATEKPMCIALATEIMAQYGQISSVELTRRWSEMKARATARFVGEPVVELRARRRAGGRRR